MTFATAASIRMPTCSHDAHYFGDASSVCAPVPTSRYPAWLATSFARAADHSIKSLNHSPQSKKTALLTEDGLRASGGTGGS